MALGLQDIREALAGQIRDNIGRQTNVYAYPPMTIAPPAIAVLSPDGAEYVDYWQTFSRAGIGKVTFTLRIYLAAGYIDAQIALDDYLSVGDGFASSVLDALLAGPTLGGVVQTCHVQGASGPLFDELTGQWVADIPIEVYAKKVTPE